MVSHPEIIEHRLHALTADDTRVENEDVENQKWRQATVTWNIPLPLLPFR